MRRWRAPVAAPALISALVLGACGCTASGTSSMGNMGSMASSPTRSASQPAPTASMAMQQEPTSPLDPKRQAVELRTGLEELFGQDVFVGIRVTRSRLRGDPDFTQAAVDALSRNSDDLATLLSRVYGSARAAKFRQLWQSQQDGLVAYARAASQHDQAAKAAARRQLDAFPGQVAQFLHTLTSGGTTVPAVSSRLSTHIDDLIRFTDAYAAGDYATAYRIERTDYEREFGLGTVVAAGIAGGPGGHLPADFDSPLTRLRSTLGELLGEHMQLVVDAMGAALRGGPEFKADAAQVNADTTLLAGAFGVLFGSQSGKRFESVWSDHVDALVSYSGAVATKDQNGRDQAMAQLRAFEKHLSAFLSTSTDGRLTAPALSDVLHMHDRDLVEQLDAYARGDYPTAYHVTYDGYQHMFAVASTLSGAIGPTIAARLPKGGVRTGGGGMAGSR
ncbi:MAG TPA: hypothetical protein VFW50_23865 [Streptosporangiaceae bacterium]|nr:hypothetical protein [Streptosporangiaceae bacterium]